MPSIRSVTVTDVGITIVDGEGVTHAFLYAAIPSTQKTIAQVQTWLNAAIASSITGCTVTVIVRSVTPPDASVVCS
jgi:hypothetical protein